MNICIKKSIEKILGVQSNCFFVGLLCCDYCKKSKAKQDIDPYTRLFVEPILLGLAARMLPEKKQEGIQLLKDTISLFESPEDELEQMKLLEMFIHSARMRRDNRYFVKYLSKFSNSAYLKLMLVFYEHDDYSPLLHTALYYVFAKMEIIAAASRAQYIYKEDGKIFFDIGASLDEGYTENLALQLANKEQSDAYVFEVNFYRKVEAFLGNEKEKLHNEFLPWVLYNKITELNPCYVYELLKASDDQNWREANQILKRMKEDSYGNDV